MKPPDQSRRRYRYCLDVYGNRIEITAGRWHGSPSYESTWEVCGGLADHLCLNEQMEAEAREKFLIWNPNAAPGSEVENRMLVGVQMTIAAVTLRHLAAAAPVFCGEDLAGADMVWPDPAAAAAYAARAALPADPVYLDFTSVDRRRSPALLIDGKQWPLTGALAYRAGGCLIVVPFAAVVDDIAAPAGQPLGRIIYGPAGKLPNPNPGDVCVDVTSGQPITPAVTHPGSRVTERLFAAVEAAGSALSVLRHVEGGSVLVGPVRVSRQVRRAAERRQERIALGLYQRPVG